MLGLDDSLAHLAAGAPFLVVLLVAVLLGLRHATDPDHLAAVGALVLQGDGGARSATRLGAWWGVGHALTLVAFGIPILVAAHVVPARVQRGAESAVAVLVVLLAVRLLVRWRHGRLERLGLAHGRRGAPLAHGRYAHPLRTPRSAFGIGLVHGMGGSAGVGVLLLAAIPSQAVAVAALVVLALLTGVSMALVTTGIGAAMTRATRGGGAPTAAVPVLGVLCLAFGLWYAAAAWALAPYPF